VPILLAKPKQ